MFSNTVPCKEETNTVVKSTMTCKIGLIWGHMKTLYWQWPAIGDIVRLSSIIEKINYANCITTPPSADQCQLWNLSVEFLKIIHRGWVVVPSDLAWSFSTFAQIIVAPFLQRNNLNVWFMSTLERQRIRWMKLLSGLAMKKSGGTITCPLCDSKMTTTADSPFK